MNKHSRLYREVLVFGEPIEKKSSERLLYDLEPTRNIRSHGILHGLENQASRTETPTTTGGPSEAHQARPSAQNGEASSQSTSKSTEGEPTVEYVTLPTSDRDTTISPTEERRGTFSEREDSPVTQQDSSPRKKEENDPSNYVKNLTHLERNFASLKDLMTQHAQDQRMALELIFQRLGWIDVSPAASIPSVASSLPRPEELRTFKEEGPSKSPEKKKTSQALSGAPSPGSFPSWPSPPPTHPRNPGV